MSLIYIHVVNQLKNFYLTLKKYIEYRRAYEYVYRLILLARFIEN